MPCVISSLNNFDNGSVQPATYAADALSIDGRVRTESNLFEAKAKLKKTLFISAMNVHAGGGRSLLLALLQSLPGDVRIVAILDRRMQLSHDAPKNLEIRTVKPSLLARLAAERWLARNVGPDDMVLCFGNLPPLFTLRGQVTLFVQNRFVLEQGNLEGFSLRTRLRHLIERVWLVARASNVHTFIVQTPSMKNLMQRFVQDSGKAIHILPFFNSSQGYSRSLESIPNSDRDAFLYVASGEPHKNHRQLIEAWCVLARDGHFPRLWLTLDKDTSSLLCTWIEMQKKQWGLNVENLGRQPHACIIELYHQASVLIYPSTFESFGLPLIEARQAGLAVLAAELDYVRDVLDPEESFDPTSSVSIARAVKRFMGWQESPLPLSNAKTFLQKIMEKSGVL